MKKYNYIEDIDDISYLKKIIDEKKYTGCDAKEHSACGLFINNKCSKKILETNLNQLIEWYNRYNRNIETQKFLDHEKKAYLSLYENKTTSSRELLNKIKENFIKESCPYCGIGGVPETIEHILPKEIYPQYSIFSKNLIPCCNACNSYKSMNIKSSENNEFCTYNFYEDEIPTEEYLEVTIDIINKIPKATFKISSLANNLFKNHVKTLKLLERYALNSNNFFSYIENKIKYNNMTKDNFIKLCKMEYEVLKEIHGFNYYKALLYREVTKSENFLNLYFK